MSCANTIGCTYIVYTNVQKAETEAVEPGLMQEAQRFFLLTQTDNLWKEHLQVCNSCTSMTGQIVCSSAQYPGDRPLSAQC